MLRSTGREAYHGPSTAPQIPSRPGALEQQPSALAPGGVHRLRVGRAAAAAFGHGTGCQSLPGRGGAPPPHRPWATLRPGVDNQPEGLAPPGGSPPARLPPTCREATHRPTETVPSRVTSHLPAPSQLPGGCSSAGWPATGRGAPCRPGSPIWPGIPKQPRPSSPLGGRGPPGAGAFTNHPPGRGGAPRPHRPCLHPGRGGRALTGVPAPAGRPVPCRGHRPGPPTGQGSRFHCTSLHFTSLHFNSLHHIEFHFTSLYLIALHFTLLLASLHFISFHVTTPCFTSLHFTSIQFISLHFTSSHLAPASLPLHSSSLHFISVHFTFPASVSPSLPHALPFALASSLLPSLHFTSLHFIPRHSSLVYQCDEKGLHLEARGRAHDLQ